MQKGMQNKTNILHITVDKMKVYKNGRFITRADRKNKRQIKIALLIGLCLVVIAMISNININL